MRYPLDAKRWLNLCEHHVGGFLGECTYGALAGVLEVLKPASRLAHKCDRPARGRDAVRLVKLARLGEPDAPMRQARDLASSASDLQHALKDRQDVHQASAPVLVAFGDVAARFAVLAATLGIDFDGACLAHARGLAGGEPDGQAD